MILIGLSGKKRTGKDTVCSMIQQLCPTQSIQRVAFADALKAEVAIATGMTQEFWEANRESARAIWQWWGTEFRRKLTRDDYWISKLLHNITSRQDVHTFIVPDVRFPNEYKMIKDVGGYIIRINRNTGVIDTHESETALDDYPYDYKIENVSSMEDLKQQVIYVLRQISKQTTQYQYQHEQSRLKGSKTS